MSTAGQWTWDVMLSAFRDLGGVAENVCLGEGPLGRGLFPIDPAKPICLRVPENLLIPVREIEFADERIRIKDSANIGRPERAFFEAYESAFSWGAEGGSSSASFVGALEALPVEVRTLLTAEFAMGEFFEGDFVERTRKWFLKSRVLDREKQDTVMPLVELANHDPYGLPYLSDPLGQLQIQGKVRDEILVRYSPQDAFGIFHSFGFATRQPQAYSVPMKAKLDGRDLRIEHDPTDQTKRGEFLTPRLRSEENTLVLSYLMIGSAKFPRLSRGIFQTLMQEAGVTNADEVFDSILFYNRMKFLKLLAALEPHGGAMVVTLMRMARYQLEAMTHCVGTRTL